jgi:hypothetical protein
LCLAPPAAFFAIVALAPAPAWGAIGCDLNFPDRDVARLFPGSTGYRTVSVEIQKLGGDRMLAKVEARLRDQLRGLYETIDVPYTIYVVHKNNEVVGYIHGVNQKGYYGGIQIFLALDLDLKIKTFYLQKMSGAYAGKFTHPDFEGQFAGLALADFDRYEVSTGQATGRLAAIRNPAPEAALDFKLTLRGLKKNLILVHEFFAISPDLATKTQPPAKS